jgi:glycosyltransferase XagB
MAAPQRKLTLIELDLSAKRVLVGWQKIMLIVMAVVLFICYYNQFDYSIFWTVIFFNVLYLYVNSYRFALMLMGAKMHQHDQKFAKKHITLTDKELPTYTILIPLFKEAAVLPKLVKAISSFDYPTAKLQVLLILEENDDETGKAIDALGLPKHFQKVVVPYSEPQTKAKACNYAMGLATGDLVCIYDAEDRPDKDQLKIVASKFAESDPRVACVQCRLCFYNGKENLLTSMFEIEYQALYTFLLPVITYLSLPTPIGGSSNHFRREFLQNIGGWDPYNVTEDADLGLRLAVTGHRVKMVYSYTPEEAPITLRAWIKQRVRWIKGYFHTFFIYFRYPRNVWSEYRISGFMFFMYIMFFGPFLTLTTPIMITISAFIIMGYFDFGGYEYPLKMFTWFNLMYTLLHFMFTSFMIARVAGHSYLKYKWILFLFYFVLHMYAAVIAVYKLFREPHKWDKTTHGVTTVDN